jgi:amino acid transporter
MGVYRALPRTFARVDPKTGSPAASTITVGLASAAVLVILSIVSNNVLGDSISALVLLIAFYYTLLGLACVWYFRRELLRSAGDFVAKGLVPMVGTVILGWALVRNLEDTYKKDYGLTSLFGIGGVFVIGVATLLIGVVLMLIWNARSREFFRGDTFAPGWTQEHGASADVETATADAAPARF